MHIPEQLWALVPLKNIDRGKERLAGVLDETARGELVTAMLHDVVEALLAVPLAPSRVLLVSEDPAARAFCAHYGLGCLVPGAGSPDPLNAALREAAAFVRERGARHVLILHADLPYARPGDIARCIEVHLEARDRDGAPRATLVSDRAGVGSNCLLLSPPDAIAPAFGLDSRRRHQAACAAAGVAFTESGCIALGRDIDLPRELAELVRDAQSPDNGCGAHVCALIRRWRAEGRDVLRVRDTD